MTPRHGTYDTYINGCDCPPCTRAFQERQRAHAAGQFVHHALAEPHVSPFNRNAYQAAWRAKRLAA
jgi:hypothetical protein